MSAFEEMQRAEWALAEARRIYNMNVEAAYKNVKEAERAYESRIRKIESSIKSLKNPLAKFKEIKLYGDRVTDSRTTIFLQQGVQTLVEVGGASGRGILNTRNIILIIKDPDGRRIFSNGGPTAEDQAQTFASLVMNTCAQIKDAPISTEERLAQLQNELFLVKADMSSIQAARFAYAQACSSTYAIQAAEETLNRLRAVSPTEVSGYERAKNEQRFKHRIWAIVAIVVALIIAALIVPAFISALLSYL